MTPETPSCPLAVALARRLRDASSALTTRWLERIAARVSIDVNRVFPTADLLDHVPILIVGVADYLESPSEDISADSSVVAKARELGQLRHEQGFDVYEILKEYEILGGVLFTFMSEAVDDIQEPCSRRELLMCAHRISRAVDVVQLATTTHFLSLTKKQVMEREERLRGFNRMVSHELRNKVGAIAGAREMLAEASLTDAQRARFLRMIGENAEAIRVLLDNLTSLSQLDGDARQQRNVLLPRAAAEVVRQLREMAESRGVEVRVGDLPEIEINAAAVELCLSNYLSNAIKYSDPAKPKRRVLIEGELRDCASDDAESEVTGCELVVRVHDNGLGVPEEARDRLFQRFFRAHAETVKDVEGTGMGLSIVLETVASLGGKAWVECEADETIFAFSLPARREADASAANAARDQPPAAQDGTRDRPAHEAPPV